MAEQFQKLEDNHIEFINAQHLFFVGTAAPDGRVNVSPKGGDALRVLGPNRVLWRNLTGSGNETAGHLLATNRITLMWCSFSKTPLILRVYGTARTVHVDDADFGTLDGNFAPHVGARQVFDVSVDLVQTSCGWAVPLMEYVEDRKILDQWSEVRGTDHLRQTHWEGKNSETIDGFPTR